MSISKFLDVQPMRTFQRKKEENGMLNQREAFSLDIPYIVKRIVYGIRKPSVYIYQEMSYFLSKISIGALLDQKNNQNLKVFQKSYVMMKKQKMRINL